MHALGCGGYEANFVHHVHAADHLAKHRVAMAIWRRRIEPTVVHQVDKKLRGGGVGVGRAGHGNGAAVVF